jgi:hypothetical protein
MSLHLKKLKKDSGKEKVLPAYTVKVYGGSGV